MGTPDEYGSAEIRQNPDGSFSVLRADAVIGISVGLLASTDGRGLWVTPDGDIAIGDRARPGFITYRPRRFALADAGGAPRVLICDRLVDGAVS